MATTAGPTFPLDLSDPRVQALIRHRTRRAVQRRGASIRAAGAAARTVVAPGAVAR